MPLVAMPKNVKKTLSGLSKADRKQWFAVYESSKKENNGDKTKAAKIAWAAIKK